MYICLYIPLARLYVYIYRVLCLKKPLNMPFLKNVKTKILIFEYFSTIPSEMNSTHPFYKKTKLKKSQGHPQKILGKVTNFQVWVA